MGGPPFHLDPTDEPGIRRLLASVVNRETAIACTVTPGLVDALNALISPCSTEERRILRLLFALSGTPYHTYAEARADLHLSLQQLNRQLKTIWAKVRSPTRVQLLLWPHLTGIAPEMLAQKPAGRALKFLTHTEGEQAGYAARKHRKTHTEP